ncbi:MAG: hypothetical protein K8R08_04360, partial [Methanosarcinales archaeon]|nr:hypothetical protein [Methanosarcinales archaeon]
MRREISIYVLVSMMCIACAASAIAQTAPFMISGYIFNSDGSPCNEPDVLITDLTTGANRTALVHPTSNYYRLLLDSSSISTGDILHFNISCSSQSQTAEHTITGSHIDNGGITNNVTFASNGTTAPVLDIPFVISGWTHYRDRDGTEYNNPVISITNLHTGDYWHPMTRSGNNYYRLILNTTDISSGDVLQFNFTDGESINLTNHTITPDDIICGGLSDFNLTSGTKAIPDIAVEVEMPEYMYPDYPDEIYVTVKNTGIKDVGLFNLSFDINEALVDTITINSLPAGE